MPKLIGHSPSSEMQPLKGEELIKKVIKLSFSQTRFLPDSVVFYNYNTSDRGSRWTLAKRWYEWYALPETILACVTSTSNMREKAFAKLSQEIPAGWEKIDV